MTNCAEMTTNPGRIPIWEKALRKRFSGSHNTSPGERTQSGPHQPM